MTNITRYTWVHNTLADGWVMCCKDGEGDDLVAWLTKRRAEGALEEYLSERKGDDPSQYRVVPVYGDVNFTPVRQPHYSPWGKVDYAIELAPGLWTVSTPGHGGVFVSEQRLSAMPVLLQEANIYGGRPGWFEEDCEAILVIAWFWNEIGKVKQDSIRIDRVGLEEALKRNINPPAQGLGTYQRVSEMLLRHLDKGDAGAIQSALTFINHWGCESVEDLLEATELVELLAHGDGNIPIVWQHYFSWANVPSHMDILSKPANGLKVLATDSAGKCLVRHLNNTISVEPIMSLVEKTQEAVNS